MSENQDRTVEKLLRQQAALTRFGSFAFKETQLSAILSEAARVCAASLGVPFSKICRYREAEGDLLIEAGCGWDDGVVGQVVSQANETSPQGRAYVTREPVIIHDLCAANNLALPAFYAKHGIVSTVDVVIATLDGAPYGVLEIDSPTLHQCDEHDINFLTGFANVLAEAVATSKKNKALRELLAQQRLMSEELQHRVRNNLQMVSTMLSNYAKAGIDDLARNVLGSLSNRVTTLAVIYDSLLGVGLSDRIDLSVYLRELSMSLPGLQPDHEKEITMRCDAESMMLPLSQVTLLGMIVTELVTNAYRHAFPGRGGVLLLTLALDEDGESATLVVSDDGVGGIKEDTGNRRGLVLTKRLVDQLSGSLVLLAGAGTSWRLCFPITVKMPALAAN